jgi:hypothetical protein
MHDGNAREGPRLSESGRIENGHPEHAKRAAPKSRPSCFSEKPKKLT